MNCPVDPGTGETRVHVVLQRKSRCAKFGFSDKANVDEGAMWSTDFALKELTAAIEAQIGALVKKAVS
jgi:hypothetical protein